MPRTSHLTAAHSCRAALAFTAGAPHACLALGLLALALSGGCASLARRSTADQIVRSRELANQGIDASQHGRHAEAEALFGEALKMCPSDEQARRRYAESLWKRGAADEAVAQMQEAARLSANNPELLVQLGQMNLERGQVDFAGQAAEKAIAADRRLASGWMLAAEVERRRGNNEAALAHYFRALSLEPHEPDAQMAVAQIYRETGKPQRALASLQSLLERSTPGEESAQALHLQGLVFRDLKRYDAAAEALSQAASRPQPSLELLYDLAETQLLAGHLDRAATAAEQALALSPQHTPSRELLGRVESQRQRVATSLDAGTMLR